MCKWAEHAGRIDNRHDLVALIALGLGRTACIPGRIGPHFHRLPGFNTRSYI